MSQKTGILYIVGIGPGHEDHMTPAALKAISEADIVIGYITYIKLIRHLISEDKKIVAAGMTEEIERARSAVEESQKGKKVAVISSGDAGVYGMAGLIFEVLREMEWKKGDSPEIKILPGITAINSCASLVGAPLVHDACTISLSDQLTPWPAIEKKIEAAASADFVIGLYNPKSGRRTEQIVIAQKIIGKYRKSNTPVALIKSAYRKRENIIISDLENFLDNAIEMLTTVIIGNSNTFIYEGYMVTPRGYTNKYTWDGEAIKGQKRGVPLKLNEQGKPVGV